MLLVEVPQNSPIEFLLGKENEIVLIKHKSNLHTKMLSRASVSFGFFFTIIGYLEGKDVV